MSITGNTIRMQIAFKTFAGGVPSSDPLNIKLTIYDNEGTKVLEVVYPTNIVRVSMGVFYYDFVVPAGTSYLTYEWYGELETKPVVDRGIITREYVVTPLVQ